MQRTTRMLGILIALQNRDHTLAELAARFECSTKTIQRDLAAIADLNIPVRTRPGLNGGIHLEQSWWLGSPNLDQDEVRLLLVALESVPVTDTRTALIEKLRAAIKPARFDPVTQDPTFPVSVSTSDAPDERMLKTIRDAFTREMWLRIEYAGSSEPGERIILPRNIYVLGGHWYVQCLDERSGETRRFRLDRILTARPCLPPTNAEELLRLQPPPPVENAEGTFTCEIELTQRGTWFCQDHPYLRYGLEGNRLTFTRPLSDLPYVANECLRLGTEGVVLAPEILREAMRTRLLQLLDHVENNQDITVST